MPVRGAGTVRSNQKKMEDSIVADKKKKNAQAQTQFLSPEEFNRISSNSIDPIASTKA